MGISAEVKAVRIAVHEVLGDARVLVRLIAGGDGLCTEIPESAWRDGALRAKVEEAIRQATGRTEAEVLQGLRQTGADLKRSGVMMNEGRALYFYVTFIA